MTSQKPGLHPRNRHRSRYDMNALCQSCPALQDYIVETPAGEPSVNFADPLAVKTLNKALLATTSPHLFTDHEAEHFMALVSATGQGLKAITWRASSVAGRDQSRRASALSSFFA